MNYQPGSSCPLPSQVTHVSLLSVRWWCCSEWRSIRPTQIRDVSGEKEGGRVTRDQIKRKSAWSNVGGGVAVDRQGGNERKFNIRQTRNLYTPMRVWIISSALSNLASSVKDPVRLEPVFYQHKGALDYCTDRKLNNPLLSQRSESPCLLFDSRGVFRAAVAQGVERLIQ